MSIAKFIFGENVPLLHLEKFSQDYILEVKNEFMMGKENPPIILSTFSDITVEQDNDDKFISNKIHLKKITGRTDNEVMMPFLEQSLALAEISPVISIKRNQKGEILEIEQREKFNFRLGALEVGKIKIYLYRRKRPAKIYQELRKWTCEF